MTNLELFISLLDTFIFAMFFVSNNGMQLLIFSEAAWIILYCTFALIAKVFDSTLMLSAVLPILIFASVDCSVWVLFLAFSIRSSKSSFYISEKHVSKFLLRSGRLLLSNRYIK